MSFVDSTAVLHTRLEALGLGELKANFDSNGWNTYSSLAFAVDYTPGGDTSTLNGFLIPTLVGDQTHLEAKVRRLHFEAYSSTMAEFQRRQLRTEDDDKIRQVPPEERKQRLDNFLAKYRGLKVDFQTEPSDHLIDRYVDIQERGVLRHVPWHEYTSKSLEVQQDPVKTTPMFKPSNDGVLRLSRGSDPMRADVSTFYLLEKAFVRRGIAMEVAGLLEYAVHEELVAWYMRELNRCPPEHYKQVGVDQVLVADREVFQRLG